MIGNPLLEVKDLKVEFVTQDGIVKAVNGISYSIEEGETVAIVGESGSGKSVGVMSLLQLVPMPPGRIVSGEALLHGRDLLEMDNRTIRSVRGKEVSIIFQDPMTSLNPVIRIGKQMTEALELHLGLSEQEARKRAVDMLKMVGIPDAQNRINSFPHEFSGGMRQRVLIAMSLVCSPDMLIADEPTTALDVTVQAQIVNLMKRLRDELGMAIIWITHDLAVVAGLAKKVIVMYAGTIVEIAEVDSLYERPFHPYTLGLLGSLPRVDLKQKNRLVSIEGMPPDMTNLPKGCPFFQRCNYSFERCAMETPKLTSVGDHHKCACWVNIYDGSKNE